MSHEINEFRRAAKFAVHRYPEIKAKAKDATNTDSWGPTSKQKELLSDASYDEEDRALVMRALWKRITKAEKPIHVTKSLDVLEYLVIHGPSAILSEMREKRATILGAAHHEGANRRVERLLDLVDNPSLVMAEREKAERLRMRMTETETATVPTTFMAPPPPAPAPAPPVVAATTVEKNVSPQLAPKPVTQLAPSGLAKPPTSAVIAPQMTSASPAAVKAPSPVLVLPPAPAANNNVLDDLFSAKPMEDFFTQKPVQTMPPPPPQQQQSMMQQQQAFFQPVGNHNVTPPALPLAPPTRNSVSPPPQRQLVDLDNLLTPQPVAKDTRSLKEMKSGFAF
jgi:hypothetical protein